MSSREDGRLAAGLLAVVVLGALPVFKFQGEVGIPDAAHSVFLHQDQPGRFLATVYDGQTVLVNDIGEVSWQHTGGLDDLWALGSNRVLRAFRAGQLDANYVQRLAVADDVRVAATYDVLRTYIPASWTEVARWSSNGTRRPRPGRRHRLLRPDPWRGRHLSRRDASVRSHTPPRHRGALESVDAAG